MFDHYACQCSQGRFVDVWNSLERKGLFQNPDRVFLQAAFLVMPFSSSRLAATGTPSLLTQGNRITDPARMLPGLSGTADDIVVIGTRADTLAASDWAGHKVLTIENWNLGRNAAFVDSAIAQRQTAYLASDINYSTLWDIANKRPTVFARELAQFFEAGYTQQGFNLIPPPLR